VALDFEIFCSKVFILYIYIYKIYGTLV